jgi:hypothetical protein
MPYPIIPVMINCQFRGHATCTLSAYSPVPFFHCLAAHRRKYAVYVPWDKSDLDATLFEYGEGDIVEIEVKAILRSAKLRKEKEEDLNNPTCWRLGQGKKYKIHAGYCRVLLGFNREIEFVVDDKMENKGVQFRSIYLMQVLDAFVEELEKRTVENPAKFRSQVLNPIIQRQRRGVSDNDSDEVKKAVGTRHKDALKFYLVQDPLDPNSSGVVLRHLLYITPVRMSLACYSSGVNGDSYEISEGNTKLLATKRSPPQEISDEVLLLPSELDVIKKERLQDVFKYLIEASVRPFLFCKSLKHRHGNPRRPLRFHPPTQRQMAGKAAAFR